MSEVRSVEAVDADRQRKLRKGAWTAFEAAPPALLVYFPRLPTAQEVTSDPSDEDTLLLDLRPRFRPDPLDVASVQAWIDEASTEGPRSFVQEFWHLKPTDTLSG